MCSTVNGERQTGNATNIPNSISDLIGEWGPWQRRTAFFIFLCKIPAAWFMACIIFTSPFAENHEFQCQQEATGYKTADNYTELSHMKLTQSDEIDSCFLYKNHTTDDDWQGQEAIVPKLFDTKPCKVFEHQSPFHSLVTQFDLVCSRTILIAVSQFFHLCGVLTGGILATKLLDLYAFYFLLFLL